MELFYKKRYIVCGGRMMPFLWKVLEHKSSTVAFREYKLMLRLAQRLLSNYSDIMLLADRSFGNHKLVNWLQNSAWHYYLRLPCDVTLHGARRHPIKLKYLDSPKSKAVFYHRVGLWLDGELRCHIVLANVKDVKELWAVRGRERIRACRGLSWTDISLNLTLNNSASI